MKIDIQKQLEKKSKEDKEFINFDPVKEVKLLLEGNELEDARILRNLSNDSEFARIERVHGEHLQLEKLENEYEGKVYTVDQIEKLAIDYNLRFLETKNYTGSFDTQVASKLREFAKSTNTSLSEWDLKNRYFILAPEEMFTLREERYISKAELDPAIFYQIDAHHYRLVHKWGNDFSIFRYLSGFRWRGYYQHWAFNSMLVSPIAALLWTFVLPLWFVTEYWLLLFPFIIGVSMLASYLIWGWKKIDNFSIIHGYFSYSKWNHDTMTVRRNR